MQFFETRAGMTKPPRMIQILLQPAVACYSVVFMKSHLSGFMAEEFKDEVHAWEIWNEPSNFLIHYRKKH
jgi:hypothetical protein